MDGDLLYNEEQEVYQIKRGDLVRIKAGAEYYNGEIIPYFVLKTRWVVKEIPIGDKAIIGRMENGNVSLDRAISTEYLEVQGYRGVHYE